MSSKQGRNKKYEFLLEVTFTWEGEANAFTFMSLKDALNAKDAKNMVIDLTVLKLKTDQKKFMVLILYN